MTPALASSIARAARAEDRIERMARLKAMSEAQLRAKLGGDPATAAPWVEAAAAGGIAAAQVQWGRMLLDGNGVPQDQRNALGWFVRAVNAEADSAKDRGEACNMVGRCFELGWGTAADAVTAVQWYQRAATSGDAWGMYNLANMLFDGRGIAQDRIAAVTHYARASELGHARAMNLLGRCLEEGWGTARDPAAAAHWYRLSAEGGYFRGAYNHGIELLRQGRRAAAAAMFELAGAEADAPMRAWIALMRASTVRLDLSGSNPR